MRAKALVVAGLSVAIGTSLWVIVLQSAGGFYKHLLLLPEQGYVLHWNLILLFASIGIVGSLLGSRVGRIIPQGLLRQGFAGFLVLLGVYMLWQNLPKF